MSVVKIAVVKSKDVIEIDLERLPEDVYKEALMTGLKALVNGGTTKITKEAYKSEDEFHSAAQEKAAERVQAMYENKLKSRGGASKSSSKVPSAVMTEARRLAKILVKQAIKDRGEKVSHYEASDITKAANGVLEDRPDLLDMARENLEARKAPTAPIEASSIAIAPSAKKVEAERVKKANAPLSKTQAGRVAQHVAH